MLFRIVINVKNNHVMFVCTEQVNAMGPLIDAELERVDRKHAQLTQLSSSLVDALNLYHTLMREPFHAPKPTTFSPPPHHPVYNGLGPGPGPAYSMPPEYMMQQAPGPYMTMPPPPRQEDMQMRSLPPQHIPFPPHG